MFPHEIIILYLEDDHFELPQILSQLLGPGSNLHIQMPTSGPINEIFKENLLNNFTM